MREVVKNWCYFVFWKTIGYLWVHLRHLFHVSSRWSAWLAQSLLSIRILRGYLESWVFWASPSTLGSLRFSRIVFYFSWRSSICCFAIIWVSSRHHCLRNGYGRISCFPLSLICFMRRYLSGSHFVLVRRIAWEVSWSSSSLLLVCCVPLSDIYRCFSPSNGKKSKR